MFVYNMKAEHKNQIQSAQDFVRKKFTAVSKGTKHLSKAERRKIKKDKKHATRHHYMSSGSSVHQHASLDSSSGKNRVLKQAPQAILRSVTQNIW